MVTLFKPLQSIHNRKLPSIFFNRTRAPHGELLGLMNPFSNRSSSCFVTSAISAGPCQYDTRETGVVPGSNSICYKSALPGGGPFNDSKTTSKSATTGMSCKSTSPTPRPMEIVAKKPYGPSSINPFPCNMEMMDRPRLERTPLNVIFHSVLGM
ncbi:unnamed protein product [Cochlearia groenlandica]